MNEAANNETIDLIDWSEVPTVLVDAYDFKQALHHVLPCVTREWQNVRPVLACVCFEYRVDRLLRLKTSNGYWLASVDLLPQMAPATLRENATISVDARELETLVKGFNSRDIVRIARAGDVLMVAQGEWMKTFVNCTQPFPDTTRYERRTPAPWSMTLDRRSVLGFCTQARHNAGRNAFVATKLALWLAGMPLGQQQWDMRLTASYEVPNADTRGTDRLTYEVGMPANDVTAPNVFEALHFQLDLKALKMAADNAIGKWLTMELHTPEEPIYTLGRGGGWYALMPLVRSK